MKLLVATTNPGKLDEYRTMLSDLNGVEWVSLQDVGLGDMDVEETGQTFAENATLKAQAYCNAAGLVTLADDSGLVVDALDGAPGIYSARYAGLPTDQARYEKVLQQLENVPHEKRTARFVCVVAVAAPDGKSAVAEGTCEGHIAHVPRGTNGFGYDPIFLTSDGRTMAEHNPDEKNRISHRGNALKALRSKLITVLESQP